MENKLNNLLVDLAKSGRSSNWSKEQKLTSTRNGLLIGKEYCVTIFQKHSCRIDEQFIHDDIQKIISDIEQFISDKRLEWVMNTDKELF